MDKIIRLANAYSSEADDFRALSRQLSNTAIDYITLKTETSGAEIKDELLKALPLIKERSSRVIVRVGAVDRALWSGVPNLVEAHHNAGGVGIARELNRGGTIVLVGPVSDAALALGPLMYEFKWGIKDWDQLASASLLGRLIHKGKTLLEPEEGVVSAFPIAEVLSGGVFELTKTPECKGKLTSELVRAQMFLGIKDPKAVEDYLVRGDYTAIGLAEIAQDRIRILGVKGNGPDYTSLMQYTQADTAGKGLVVPKSGERVSNLGVVKSVSMGDSVSVVVVALDAEGFGKLKKRLSAQVVKDLCPESCLGWVRRYSIDGLLVLSFILDSAVGEGHNQSLRGDKTGTRYAQLIEQFRWESV